MAHSSSKKSRKKGKRIIPHPTRVRFLKVVTCTYCEAQIYKRHLGTHIKQFHADRSSSQPFKLISSGGIKGIELSELSPEMQRKIIEKYAIDESGFMIAYGDRDDNHPSDDNNDIQLD